MNSEKTTLSSLRNKEWRIVKKETNKIYQVLPYISTNNITELDELIYAGVKLVCEKIRIPSKSYEGGNYTNRDWCFWYSHQRIIKGTGRLGNWRKNGDHYIIENGQNNEKSPGDLRRLAISQTLVKDHQLKLMWKTHKE